MFKRTYASIEDALSAHFKRQREWSEKTLGPPRGTQRNIDHIRKELIEIEAEPLTLKEWIDVATLAFDGAWRAGHSPEAIARAFIETQERNERREWPDWRTVEPNKAVEHIRTDKWEQRFLGMARLISSWSKDSSTKCGAVIVRPDRTLAALGYNGFPRGVDDDHALYLDRPRKYERVVHAEMNAILSAAEPVRGYDLYVWPPSEAPTCNRCAAHVIQAGIARVFYQHDSTSTIHQRWSDYPEEGLTMFREAGIEVISL